MDYQQFNQTLSESDINTRTNHPERKPTRICVQLFPTSTRSTGFCVIWACISSSSNSSGILTKEQGKGGSESTCPICSKSLETRGLFCIMHEMRSKYKEACRGDL